ncbi:epimerase, partial [Bacillus thuringiensis]|nr:epimerase [Bacillus thuringiensis]
IKALVQEAGENIAPYNEVTNCTLHNGKARKFGFLFRELKLEMKNVLKHYINTMK